VLFRVLKIYLLVQFPALKNNRQRPLVKFLGIEEYRAATIGALPGIEKYRVTSWQPLVQLLALKLRTVDKNNCAAIGLQQILV
jgi:hypothetical protein